ncbi:MAG TPA: YcdB/YcdC domain-containing protein, partial [Clostridia bacterium]
MKRLISLILVAFILLTSLIQVNVFAENDSGLQNALKAAKSKFEIPSGLSEFNYSIGTEGDKKVWALDWSSKEGDGHIRVSVDEKGNIIHYYNDKPTMTQYKRKLPKVSRQDAKAMADDFISKMDASLPGQIKYVENTQSLDMGNVYYLNYTRTVNGIAFPENYIQINVNAETGEIQNYNRYWTDDLSFPDKVKTISLDIAKSSFKEKLGLVLSYAYRLEDKKVKTFLMYSPKDTNSFIDATTGEKITLNNPVMVAGGYADFSLAKGTNYGKDGSGQISYTPDEIKAISEASSIISKEDIEKRIRALKVLGLNDKYTVTSVSLDKDGFDNENLAWNFYFMEDSKDSKGVPPGTVSVSADAKTGEIKSFWIGAPNQDGGTAKYDKAASKTTVEEFLKEIQPDKFKETVYKENPEQIVVPYMEKESLRDYNFNYVRMVNGVAFPANSLSVGFNAVSGKITSYNSSWFNTAF